jgi:hypothetical protein
MVMYLDFDPCLSFNTKNSKFRKWFQVLSLRVERIWTDLFYVLCFFDRVPLYSLVNEANLVHNLLLVYLFLVYWTGCTLHTRQSSTQNNKYQVSHEYICFYWWWERSRPKHVDIDKYTKNKLCTKLALFTRWTDLSSVEHLVTPIRLKTEIEYVSKYCGCTRMLETNVKDNLNVNNITRWAAASQNKFKLSVFILFFSNVFERSVHLVNICAQRECYI